MQTHPMQYGVARRCSFIGIAVFLALAAALPLASCGVTTTDGIGGHAPQPAASTDATTLATATSIRKPTATPAFAGITNVGSGCPTTIAGNAVPAATVMLTQTSTRPIVAKVGDTIGLDLSAAYQWAVSLDDPSHALTPIDPQGKRDIANNTCDWRFLATAPGQVTVNVAGVAGCQPPRMCPAVALDLSYALTVQR